MNRGYIKINRVEVDKFYKIIKRYNTTKMLYLGMFMDIICNKAKYKNGKAIKRGLSFQYQKGSIIESIKQLNEDWEVSDKTVKRLFRILQDEGIVEKIFVGSTSYFRLSDSILWGTQEPSTLGTSQPLISGTQEPTLNENKRSNTIVSDLDSYSFREFIKDCNEEFCVKPTDSKTRNFTLKKSLRESFNARMKEGYTRELFRTATVGLKTSEWILKNNKLSLLNPDFLLAPKTKIHYWASLGEEYEERVKKTTNFDYDKLYETE